MASLVVIPVNVLIDQLFRRSVPKPTKVNQDKHGLFSKVKFNGWFSKTKKSPDTKPTDIPNNGTSSKDPDADAGSERSGSAASFQSSTSKSSRSLRSRISSASSKSEVVQLSQEEIEEKVNDNVERMATKGKKKKTLPYWCAYVAWVLVFGTSAASAFFTFTYSIEWGRDRSHGWLTSMVMSVVESVLLIQPGKVGTRESFHKQKTIFFIAYIILDSEANDDDFWFDDGTFGVTIKILPCLCA